jgi:hypothetical protein
MLRIGGRNIEDPIVLKEREDNRSVRLTNVYFGLLRNMPEEFHNRTTIARLQMIQNRLDELGLPQLTQVRAVKFHPKHKAWHVHFSDTELVSFIAYTEDHSIGWYKSEANTIGGGHNYLLFNKQRVKVNDLKNMEKSLEELVEYAKVYRRVDVTNAHMALAVPYQRRESALPLYMASLPSDIRQHILRFLRSSRDTQRIMFPLIIRELQLQPVMPLPLEQDEDIEEVMEQILALSPVVQVEPQLLLEYKKDCPAGQELNVTTGRCRKMCEEHQVRNEKGRCVSRRKSPKRKSQKRSKSPKRKSPCPKGQVRDAITKLCRKDRRRK